MDETKRQNLLNAAMKEFAENQFKKASTNTIVKEAGISKGLLYHYFDTKEVLYHYLVDFCIATVMGRISQEIIFEERDILKRLEAIIAAKMSVMAKYPYMLSFLRGMDFETTSEKAKGHGAVSRDVYYEKDVDATLFKEGVDVAMAVKSIRYTLEGISEASIKNNQEAAMPIEKLKADIEAYMKHFRQVYYK